MPNSHTPAFFVAQAYARAGGAFTFLGTFHADLAGLVTYTPTVQEAAMQSIVCVGASAANPTPLVYPLTEGQFYLVVNNSTNDVQIIGTSGTGATVSAGSKAVVATDGTNFYNVASGGAVTLNGDVNGPAGANSVVNAHIPANVIPQLGSGNDTVSPDNNNPLTERQGNWTALGADGFISVPTVPALPFLSASFVGTLTVEIHITKDGDTTQTGFGVWRRTIFVRNNAGTMMTPSGGSSDADISIPNNLGTGVSTAQSKIDVSTTTPVVKVSRPAGVPCHARAVIVDYPSGWSGF
jgi:hypothetical protein